MLPPKARIVLAPHDESTTQIPRVVLPDDPTLPPVYVPGPIVLPRPAPPSGDSLTVIDISASLPHEPQGPYGQQNQKASITFHWLGGNFSRSASDEECVAALQRIAYDHIRKDWSGNGSGSFGDTIMYHEAHTPSGTVLILRDYLEVAWHAGTDLGNRTSRAILVLCGPDTPPTDRQMRTLRMRRDDFITAQLYGHMDWSATQCPGPTIMEEVRTLRA